MKRSLVMLSIACLALAGSPGLSLTASDRAILPGPVLTELPTPQTRGPMALEETLAQRRSVRAFKNTPLSLQDVSQLLWAGQGFTGADGRRTAPSAGALYPLELYLVAGDIAGLSTGVYRYLPGTHQLQRILDTDRRAAISTAALHQNFLRSAPATIVIAGVVERLAVRYGQRSERYLHMEAGHAGQNVALQAVALALGTVTVGAFEDERIKRTLHLPPDEEPLALMPIGKPTESNR